LNHGSTMRAKSIRHGLYVTGFTRAIDAFKTDEQAF